MARRQEKDMDKAEERYPGITEQIRSYRNAELPARPRCQSEDTARVSCGIIGRSIVIAGATTKIRLIPNPPKPGEYFCNECQKYFD